MEASIVAFTLVLIRVATFWFTIPIFGHVNPPRTVKVGLSFGLTVFWYWQMEQTPVGVAAAMEGGLKHFELVFLGVREIVIGALLGFCFHLFIVPMRIAGSYLAQELGLSLASLSDPTSPESSTVISTITQLIGLLLFFILNLHHLIILLLNTVFEHIPVGSPVSFDSSGVLIEAFSGLVGEGIGIIGPASVALLILLVAVLLLAKAVPTLNLFSVGISIRLGFGLLIILIFLPDILHKTSIAFETAENFIEQFVITLIHV